MQGMEILRWYVLDLQLFLKMQILWQRHHPSFILRYRPSSLGRLTVDTGNGTQVSRKNSLVNTNEENIKRIQRNKKEKKRKLTIYL